MKNIKSIVVFIFLALASLSSFADEFVVIGHRGGGGGNTGIGPLIGGGRTGPGHSGGMQPIDAEPGVDPEAKRKRECNRKKAESNAITLVCTANRDTEFASALKSCPTVSGEVSGGFGGIGLAVKYESNCERLKTATRDSGKSICLADAALREAKMQECW
jgi:hypothetical protein